MHVGSANTTTSLPLYVLLALPDPLLGQGFVLLVLWFIIIITNKNNNRRLVTLAEHTSNHGKQTNSSTKEKGEHG